MAQQGIDLGARQSFLFRAHFFSDELYPCRRGQGQIALLDQPGTPGTDPQIDGADGLVLFMLEDASGANQRDWCEIRELERHPFLPLIPFQKRRDGLEVFVDRDGNTILLLSPELPPIHDFRKGEVWPISCQRGN